MEKESWGELVLYDDLESKTASQKEIVDANEKYIWVRGSAGTGKSVVLCRRAMRLAKELEDSGSDKKVLLVTGTTNLLFNYIYGVGNNGKNRLEDCKSLVYGSLYLVIEPSIAVGVAELDSCKDFRITKAAKDEGITEGNIAHVLVDEAQDMTVYQLKFLLSLASDSVTVVGSETQNIFASFYPNKKGSDPIEDFKKKRMNWQGNDPNNGLEMLNPDLIKYSNGSNPGDSLNKLEKELGENCKFNKYTLIKQFRMSNGIISFAKYIRQTELKDNDVKDLEEGTGIDGDKPRLRICDDRDTEYKYLHDAVKKVMETDQEKRIGIILGRKSKQADEIEKKFGDTNIRVYKIIGDTQKYKRNPFAPGIYILNVADAKGLDFDEVYIFLDNDNYWRDASGLKNLYVSVTRARAMVTMLCSDSGSEKGKFLENWGGKAGFNKLESILDIKAVK